MDPSGLEFLWLACLDCCRRLIPTDMKNAQDHACVVSVRDASLGKGPWFRHSETMTETILINEG